METMFIAKTIIQQIKAQDPYALMAYGSSHFAALSSNDQRLGGLEFQVSGLVFVGCCKIELTFMDTYRVLFINRKREVVKVVEECYVDQLIEILDYVEGR